MDKLNAKVRSLQRDNLKLRALLGLSPEESIPDSKEELKTRLRERDEQQQVQLENGVKGKKRDLSGKPKIQTDVKSEEEQQDEQLALKLEKQRVVRYKQWKQYLPFLYEFVVVHVLAWPSLTVAWVPDVPLAPETPKGTSHKVSNYMLHRLLLASNSQPENKNESILKCQVRLPSDDQQEGDSIKELSNTSKYVAKLETISEYVQGSLVHRVRPMPQHPELFASSRMDGMIYILNAGDDDKEIVEHVKLKGHTKHGYGLCWSKLKEGYLLSSAEDSLVCLWDAGPKSSQRKAKDGTMLPLVTFKGHTKGVGDVRWHPNREHEFASVDEDAALALWDTRSNASPTHKIKAHECEVYCLDFSVANEHCLVTGASDSTLRMWDMRKLKAPVHHFLYHTDEILQIQWSPCNPNVFCTSSRDTKVCIWDTSLINASQTQEEALDGPPELLFVHSGHTDAVFDVSWNPANDWTLASTAEDNIVQIWSVAEALRT